MRWHPDPEHTSAWSAVGGVVMLLSGSSAVLLAIQPVSEHVPKVVIYACGVLALTGLYGMLAPLLHWWPWRSALSARALGSATPPERIENRLIRLADDLPPGLSPMGHTFENCQIVGPANVLFGECHIEHSAWIRPELIIVPDPTTLPPGTIAFYGCRFLHCKFSSITAVGTEAEINALRAIFPPGIAR